ncbi:unnamed protein product [Boreogadus saida]
MILVASNFIELLQATLLRNRATKKDQHCSLLLLVLPATLRRWRVRVRTNDELDIETKTKSANILLDWGCNEWMGNFHDKEGHNSSSSRSEGNVTVHFN